MDNFDELDELCDIFFGT